MDGVIRGGVPSGHRGETETAWHWQNIGQRLSAFPWYPTRPEALSGLVPVSLVPAQSTEGPNRHAGSADLFCGVSPETG